MHPKMHITVNSFQSLIDTCHSSDAGRVLLSLDECGVHDVTGVLKQYLRQLPDPVIPGHMYKQFIAASSKYRLSLQNRLSRCTKSTLDKIQNCQSCSCFRCPHVQFSSVYCFVITKCTNANYYYLNTNGEEAQGKPPG